MLIVAKSYKKKSRKNDFMLKVRYFKYLAFTNPVT